jgi:sterol desaturase/sphingolipid hydroxylase (fatty acid hydroxylase superfamily)
MDLRLAVLPPVIYGGLGLLFHAAEERWPLRTYTAPKTWAFDAFALTFGVTVATAIQLFYRQTVGRLPAVRGFSWLASSSTFVSAHVPWPIALAVSIVVLDFLFYVGHRMLHSQALWHTHALHHSPRRLYWFAGNRASPLHLAVQYLWPVLLGLLWPVGGGVPALVTTSFCYSLIQHFNHANLRWRLGPLEWLFVVPRYHLVHHGADQRLNDSNFGSLLTIWDRAFGTYTNPDHVPENFVLGLNYECPQMRLFIGLPPGQKRSSARARSHVLVVARGARQRTQVPVHDHHRDSHGAMPPPTHPRPRANSSAHRQSRRRSTGIASGQANLRPLGTEFLARIRGSLTLKSRFPNS